MQRMDSKKEARQGLADKEKTPKVTSLKFLSKFPRKRLYHM